ncbi:D-mannonate oxidoreductase|nr:D-mannonate oxidoreductase [Candidatus Pantoea persica]
MANSSEGEARVRALLEMKAVFGEDLARNETVVATLTRFWLQLRKQGARATVAQVVNSL